MIPNKSICQDLRSAFEALRNILYQGRTYVHYFYVHIFSPQNYEIYPRIGLLRTGQNLQDNDEWNGATNILIAQFHTGPPTTFFHSFQLNDNGTTNFSIPVFIWNQQFFPDFHTGPTYFFYHFLLNTEHENFINLGLVFQIRGLHLFHIYVLRGLHLILGQTSVGNFCKIDNGQLLTLLWVESSGTPNSGTNKFRMFPQAYIGI